MSNIKKKKFNKVHLLIYLVESMITTHLDKVRSKLNKNENFKINFPNEVKVKTKLNFCQKRTWDLPSCHFSR